MLSALNRSSSIHGLAYWDLTLGLPTHLPRKAIMVGTLAPRSLVPCLRISESYHSRNSQSMIVSSYFESFVDETFLIIRDLRKARSEENFLSRRSGAGLLDMDTSKICA